MKELKMREGKNYSSVTCEHRCDILTCPECDIFKKGAKIKKPRWWKFWNR